MGMKRFSAPPALYPPTPPAVASSASEQLATTTTTAGPQPGYPTSIGAPTAVTGTTGSPPSPPSPFHPFSGGGGGGGGGSSHLLLQQHQQQHQNLHHHHHHHHLHHDSTSKRVKTEQTFESLFDKETHSDVTVSVNGDECVFHAHRMILAMKSEVLAARLQKLTGGGGVTGLGDSNGSSKPDIQMVAPASLPAAITPSSGTTSAGLGRSGVPVLHVQEDAECCHVFSRFLYFLYSGAVWLHQDYVLPLYRLAHKYGVKALRTHCETYILQVLAKSCGTMSASPSSSSSSASHTTNRHHHQNHHHHHHSNNHHHHHQHHNHNNNNNNILNHNHSPSNTPLLTSPNANSPPYVGSGFALSVVCDLYEDERYEGDIQLTAHRLLCCQFRQLVRSERWLRCSVGTVCGLIGSDGCNVEENLILVSATDYMKRRQLADKRQIEDILSLIRYPRLNRRVLYHLHKNGSFNNFPHVQQLMVDALKYHSFKDLPEARDDFVGPQFRPRMSNNGSPNRRASMHVATMVNDSYPQDHQPAVFSEAAYSLDPAVPVVLSHSRQSQV